MVQRIVFVVGNSGVCKDLSGAGAIEEDLKAKAKQEGSG
jgi:hypothetical protein